ncbi:metal-dependent transcriptional regulator [Niabella terrae]
MSQYTEAEENYIKHIYHLSSDSGRVSTNDLAASLSMAPASVTDMLKKLKRKKLVSYEAYYGCGLSPAGLRVAMGIIRKHRLWEYFLSQILGFAWNEVHEVAEQLEHVSSQKLIDKLDEFLGFPRTDPHGDPIPDANGKLSQQQLIPLSELKENQKATVIQIRNQSAELLRLLSDKKIGIGTRLELIKKSSFDGSLEIRTDNRHRQHFSRELAATILLASS